MRQLSQCISLAAVLLAASASHVSADNLSLFCKVKCEDYGRTKDFCAANYRQGAMKSEFILAVFPNGAEDDDGRTWAVSETEYKLALEGEQDGIRVKNLIKISRVTGEYYELMMYYPTNKKPGLGEALERKGTCQKYEAEARRF